MIKNFKLAWFFCLACAVFVGCSDDDDDDNNGGGNGGGNEKEVVLTPEEQKQKLEDISLELLGKFNADDYKEVVEPLTYLVEILKQVNPRDDYAYAAVRSTAESICDIANGQTSRAYNFLSKESLEDFFNLYEKLGLDIVITEDGPMLNDKGTPGEVNIYFNDQNATPWHAKLSVSEKGSPIIVGEIGAILPEVISFKLDKADNPSKTASISMKLSTTATINNAVVSDLSTVLILDICDTKFSVSVYAKENGASCHLNVSNSKEGLIEVNATIAADKLSYYPGVDGEEVLGKLKKATADANIIDQLQVKGTCNNAATFIAAIKKADSDNEEKVKQAVAAANKELDLGIYYDDDKFKNQQAAVIVISREDYGYWYAEPVLSFEDETTYAFKDFFNTGDFGEVISKAVELADSFYDLIFGNK